MNEVLSQEKMLFTLDSIPQGVSDFSGVVEKLQSQDMVFVWEVRKVNPWLAKKLKDYRLLRSIKNRICPRGVYPADVLPQNVYALILKNRTHSYPEKIPELRKKLLSFFDQNNISGNFRLKHLTVISFTEPLSNDSTRYRHKLIYATFRELPDPVTVESIRQALEKADRVIKWETDKKKLLSFIESLITNKQKGLL